MKAELPVLVVGGGIGGTSAAIALAARGFDVELVEVDPEWGVYGAGITITGPTYRAFETLGLLDELLESGYGARGGTRICTADGTVLTEVAGEPLGPRLPPLGGIMRPRLHELLSTHTRKAGVRVRLGVSYVACENREDHVRVAFTDGSTENYAVVIVADGAHSKSRGQLLSYSRPPDYTGQYCWRLVARRPPEIDRGFVYIGGPVFAGLVPTSETQMYMWLLETRGEKARVEADQLPTLLARHMAPFGGLLGQLREGLNSQSIINCRPLEAVMLPSPWYRGRIVLIGDAAHSTTPHLASGAGIAVEDAVVLATLLSEMDSVDAAFMRFMELRFERCRDVVESSVAIGALQQSGASPAAYGALLAGAEQRLQADIWAVPAVHREVVAHAH